MCNRPGKTGLINTKYTCSYYSTSLAFYMGYPKFVSFIEFLMDFCIYSNSLDTICIRDKKLLHFKLLKSGQILHIDKTGSPRSGHMFIWAENTENFRWYKISRPKIPMYGPEQAFSGVLDSLIWLIYQHRVHLKFHFCLQYKCWYKCVQFYQLGTGGHTQKPVQGATLRHQGIYGQKMAKQI